ncbi:ribonuclease H-like domain-containing protein [Tanacetum coccineum]
MPTVGSSPVAATRQPTSPSPHPTSTSARPLSTDPQPYQPTNHSHFAQPTPSAPTNPTPTTNLLLTPPPVPSPATTQPNRNPTSTHSMVTRYRVGTNRPTQRYTLSVSTISPLLPKSYNHAFQDPHWYRAMLDEYNALIKNNLGFLCHHSFARLVANGSTQLTGIDVDETFSPVVKPATIRTVLSLALSRHWPVHQLDVKNAFLHGSLSETVYMQQPPGFRDSQHPDHVCLLQRSLYGLKQAPRAWFQRFAAYAARVGFIHSRCDTSLFIYRRGSDTTYLLLYVDDIILLASLQLSQIDTDSKLSSADGDPFLSTSYRSVLCAGPQVYVSTCMIPREPQFSALKRILRSMRDYWLPAASNAVLHVPSRYQYADIFTKGLPTVLFDEFRSSLSVRSSPPAQTQRDG